MAELQKIKREKAAEEREKEEIRQQEEERIRLVRISVALKCLIYLS